MAERLPYAQRIAKIGAAIQRRALEARDPALDTRSQHYNLLVARAEHHAIDDDNGKLGIQINKNIFRIDRAASQRRYACGQQLGQHCERVALHVAIRDHRARLPIRRLLRRAPLHWGGRACRGRDSVAVVGGHGRSAVDDHIIWVAHISASFLIISGWALPAYVSALPFAQHLGLLHHKAEAKRTDKSYTNPYKINRQPADDGRQLIADHHCREETQL